MATTAQTPFDVLNMTQEFLLDRPVAIDDGIRDKLKELARPGAVPPPIAVKELAELVYARREDLPPEVLTIGVQAVNLLMLYDQYGYRGSGRGFAMASEFQRQPGMNASLADDTLEAPEPDSQYLPVVEPVIAPEKAAPPPADGTPVIAPPAPQPDRDS